MFALSPTMTVSVLVSARPVRLLNMEAVPKPSRKEADPPPAIVVTTPRGVIMRIR